MERARYGSKEHLEKIKNSLALYHEKNYEKRFAEGRVCIDCKQQLSWEMFSPKKKGSIQISPVCKECAKKRFAIWDKSPAGLLSREKRKQNSKAKYSTEERTEKARLYREKMNRLWAIFLVENNLHKCCRCGYDKNSAAIDYHHTNPSEKEFHPADLLGRPPTEKRMNELKKTIPLCSNCHREEHFPNGYKIESLLSKE